MRTMIKGGMKRDTRAVVRESFPKRGKEAGA